MALAQYQPWNLVNQLQDDINRLFSGVDQSDSSGATADWAPAADVIEYADRFELALDLPGVDAKSVDITLSKGVLSISGDRGALRSVDDNQPIRHRLERRNGRFYRRFILPDTVDSDAVKATSQHGVLQITIPKTPEVQPRRITVSS